MKRICGWKEVDLSCNLMLHLILHLMLHWRLDVTSDITSHRDFDVATYVASAHRCYIGCYIRTLKLHLIISAVWCYICLMTMFHLMSYLHYDVTSDVISALWCNIWCYICAMMLHSMLHPHSTLWCYIYQSRIFPLNL